MLHPLENLNSTFKTTRWNGIPLRASLPRFMPKRQLSVAKRLFAKNQESRP